LAKELYLGPAVKNVELDEEVRRKLPWGAEGSVDDLLLFDWNDINARRAELTDMWNREIAR
jgi:putative spermidine/putrescine transport system substrate-binding protein